ncbi:hypothetical protein MXB_1325 [Myxobolus squamalis]|nr:hypothetical protein MXB_1325 [Myxobolus squamalis]
MSDDDIKQYAESDLGSFSFYAKMIGKFYLTCNFLSLNIGYLAGASWGAIEYCIKNRGEGFNYRRVWNSASHRSHLLADNLTFFGLSAYGINVLSETIRGERDSLNTTIAGLTVGSLCRIGIRINLHLGSPRPVVFLTSALFGSIGFLYGQYYYGFPNHLYKDFRYRL